MPKIIQTNILKEVAKKLYQAYETKKPIEFIRHNYDLDEASAYAVQNELVERLADAEQSKVAGYKISMTSAETQAIANTDEPAYGTLLTNHLIKSGEHIELSTFFSPLIEPEIIFIIEEDLSYGANEDEIIEKIKLAAGIEIPDARYKKWFPNFSLTDLISDNTATGCVVISEPVSPLSIEEMEMIKMKLYHNGKKISEGVSSAVLGNPVKAVAWLAEKLASHQKQLKKGMIISSGTFISPLPLESGTYTVSYTSVGEATIHFE